MSGMASKGRRSGLKGGGKRVLQSHSDSERVLRLETKQSELSGRDAPTCVKQCDMIAPWLPVRGRGSLRQD